MASTERVVALCDGLDTAWIQRSQIPQVCDTGCSQALRQLLANAGELAAVEFAAAPQALTQALVQQERVACCLQPLGVCKVPKFTLGMMIKGGKSSRWESMVYTTHCPL